jgi:two-component system OmpR family sensor kinase
VTDPDSERGAQPGPAGGSSASAGHAQTAAAARPVTRRSPIRSLRVKLLTLNAIVLVGMAVLTGAFLFRSLSVTLKQNIDLQLTQLASQLAAVVKPLPDDLFLIELTDQLSEIFANSDADEGYYCLWDSRGELIDASHPDLDTPRPDATGPRDRRPYREITLKGPRGSLILVGRSAAADQARLREVAGRFVVTAAIMITVLLGAGWFLTQRALSPIRRIADAAAAVSLSNLSQRIDVDAMERELSDLATTINNTFDRLQRSFDQQSRFRAHASHELRTPLAIILANVDLALRRERTPDEYQQTLTTISKSAYRMKAIIEGLLSLAQAESGQLQVNFDRTSLRDVVESTCGLMQPLADKKGMRIRFAAPSDCRVCDVVLGDADRLTEAVTNLISNAVLYGDQKSDVDVSLTCTATTARVAVRNSGHPIPESDRAFLFTPFYRVDGSQTRHATGCGLGLAITYWIIEAHGGTVDVQSDAEHGTVFTIELPLKSARDPASSDVLQLSKGG